MIFTPNNKKRPVVLRDVKLGGYFQSSLMDGIYCRCSVNVYEENNVFELQTGKSENWDLDQAVIPVEITEVKFNYL